MKQKRQVIEIDEAKCDGCGQCVTACAEGAIAIIDGKAKLVSDVYCDGLGACLGECPQDALKVIEREAEEFNQEAVEARLALLAALPGANRGHQVPDGCPGAAAMTLERREPAGSEEPAGELHSELLQWPLKLQLLAPQAPFLKGADLLLLADCVAAAFPDLHRKLLRGHMVAMGCPKLDDLEAHIHRLAAILQEADINSLTVAHMEVPCCHGFVHAAQEAVRRAGLDLPVETVMISRTGEVLAPGPASR